MLKFIDYRKLLRIEAGRITNAHILYRSCLEFAIADELINLSNDN